MWRGGPRGSTRSILSIGVCAGNRGVDARREFLGHLREAVTVSNYMDHNGRLSSTDRYATSSGHGPVVDIGAPGTMILSTTIDKPGNPGYQRKTDSRTRYPGRGGNHDERLLLMRSAGAGASTDGCGNGVCESDETDASCGEDCGCGAASDCGVAPFGCYCDADCAASDDCCADAATACPGGQPTP
jgi:hypothetical protein